jgi:DNA modification methylase
LDPFGGSGTTARVATRHGRDAILIELNPQYIGLADERTAGVQMSLESVV